MKRLEEGGELGRYRILKRLGAGAMGEVFLAEDPQIGRQVALKTVRVEEGKARDLEERKQRLLREARAAGKILHPNIVALFDAGEDEGIFYLAFEFVEGMDLADRTAEGPELSLGEVLSIIRQASDALDAAHRQGVVHRDIKPSNIMITSDGRVKIADFGIARVADQTSDLTMTGSVVGSPHYMSPEQIKGEPLDGRTDIFSLGVLFYEILCRRRPFEGETLTTLVYQILNQEPTPLVVRRPDLGPRLEQLVSRMMHKDRDQRFSTAAEVAREIAECERELSADKLAGAVLPDSGPIGATVFMAEEPSTTVRPAASAPTPRAGTGPAAAAPPAPAAPVAAASAASKSRSTLIVVALVAVVVLGLLVAAGFAARSFLRAQRAKLASQEAVEQLQAEATDAVEKLGATTPTDNRIAQASPLAQPEPGEPEPESGTPDAPPNPALTGATTGPANQPDATPTTYRTPDPTPTTNPPTTTPPVRREPVRRDPPVRTEPVRQPEPEPEPQAPPPDPRELRESVIRNARVDREMSTGMNLSFEVEPKKAAERIIVRLDRIVVGQASEWDASKRNGRAYSVPESGLHILSFLVDGNEVYRIRIDARPGGGPNPTPVAVHLPQLGRR